MNEPLIPEAKFRRLLVAGLAWPAVLVLLFCLALVYQGIVAGAHRDAYMAAQLQDNKARGVRTELLDMETGIRGYLLTGDREYLPPYEDANGRMQIELRELVSASQNDPATNIDAVRIRRDSLAWMQTAFALKDGRSNNKPTDVGLLNLGKKQFDGLREDFTAFFDVDDQTMLRSQEAWFTGRFRVVITLIVGAILVVAILTALVSTLLRRLANMYHAALSAYEASAHQIRDLNAGLEQRVKDRTTDLTRANQELEAFSYSVSHDLRAPLRSVASFSAIIDQDVGASLDVESKDNLKRIRVAAAKMATLIDALLKFSRIARTALNRSVVDVSQMVQSILADLGRESQIQIESKVGQGLVADADTHLLRVVFENLLENAWKFSSKTPNPKIEVGMKDGAFFVSDNGVGFEQKYVEKVFLPFERLHTESDFPGTGIGLATTKRIVERHGGNIWAESVPNVGTTFHFTLGADEDRRKPHAMEPIGNPEGL